MRSSISQRALGASLQQQTDEVFLVLVEIGHASLSEPIRVVNNNENVTSLGNLYVAFPFEIDLPGEDSDRPPGARLRIDNVDRTIVQTLRRIASPPTVTIRIILAATPDTIELELAGLTLRNATYDAATVTGDLAFEQIMVEPVATMMTPAKFPGIF